MGKSTKENKSKRKRLAENSSSDPSDQENLNSNHSAEATVVRKRQTDKNEQITVTIKNKQARTRSESSKLDSSQNKNSHLDGVDLVRVNKDQDTVVYEVRGSQSDFNSDGQIPSGSESEEEGLLHTDEQKNASDDEQDSQLMDTEHDSEDKEDETESELNTSSARKFKGAKNKRQSMKEKIDMISCALSSLQDIMLKKGFLEDGQSLEGKKLAKGSTERGKDQADLDNSVSETTIYRSAVEKEDNPPIAEFEKVDVDSEITLKLKKLRDSTSSEEPIDTSDEMIDFEMPADFDNVTFAGRTKTRRPPNKGQAPREAAPPVRRRREGFVRQKPPRWICSQHQVINLQFHSRFLIYVELTWALLTKGCQNRCFLSILHGLMKIT